MKSRAKKLLILIASLLPIPSLTFAGELAAAVDPGVDKSEAFDFENELFRRLVEGTLSDKYYDFFRVHEIKSIEHLNSPELANYKLRLVEYYRNDMSKFIEQELGAKSGAISIVAR